MKKNYSILLRFAFVAVAFAGMASCVKPEIDGCVDPRGNVRLTVNLDVDIASRSNPARQFRIDSALVYVFGADNKFVDSRTAGEYTGEPYEFWLDLGTGDYHFIVWTNPGDYYRPNTRPDDCTDSHDINDLHYYLDYTGYYIYDEIPDLLHGIRSGESIIANQDNLVQVLMRPNTYTINVKVKGLPETPDAFDFSITDNNSHYTFDNKIIDDKDDFRHVRSCRQQDGELDASIKTLRLAETRSPQFVFENATTGDELFSNCLVETITDAYEAAGLEVDFDTVYTYDIVLIYDSDMNLTVSVNGWNYTPEDIEF